MVVSPFAAIAYDVTLGAAMLSNPLRRTESNDSVVMCCDCQIR